MPGRSTTTSTVLYFLPGGHTHDRHTIPSDRLHISLSDPVLAAEERLSSVPDRNDPSIIKVSSTRNTSIDFHLKGRIVSQRSDDDGLLSAKAMETKCTHGATTNHLSKASLYAAAAHRPSLQVASDDSWDIADVMSVMDISGSSTSENGLDLPPLASETFKEEMYIRGYLKRPASRPADLAPQKSRTRLTFMRGKVFPKVLGRRRGRKVAESLKAKQDTARPPDGPDTRLSDNRLATVTPVTLRAPQAGGPVLEFSGMDTTTSASETSDLHEFSYITAFTTPPSSPSTVLDAEAFGKGAGQVDSKHGE